MKIIQAEIANVEKIANNLESTMRIIRSSIQERSSAIQDAEIESAINEATKGLSDLKRLTKKLKAASVLHNTSVLDSVNNVLAIEGESAYDYARIEYTKSNLLGLGVSTAQSVAYYLDTYFQEQGITTTEWSDMNFDEEAL